MSDKKQKDINDLGTTEAFTQFQTKNGSDNYSVKWSRCPSRVTMLMLIKNNEHGQTSDDTWLYFATKVNGETNNPHPE